MAPSDLECDFCRELAGRPGHAFDDLYGRGAESRRLWRTDSFVALPTLGPLTEGHLLLLPFQHVTALTELSESEWREFYPAYGALQSFLSESFGDPVSFEHGLPPGAVGEGCGVLHAHLHLVPTKLRIGKLPRPRKGIWKRLQESDWLAEVRNLLGPGDGYLFAQPRGSDRFVLLVRHVESQFMRRWLAAEMGLFQWDWRSVGFDAGFPTMIRALKVGKTPSGFVRYP